MSICPSDPGIQPSNRPGGDRDPPSDAKSWLQSWACLKLAARNLTRNQTRTVISLAAIASGVVALLLTGGFVEWVERAMREDAIQTGLGHIQISRPGFRNAGFANPSAYLLSPTAPELEIIRATREVEAVDERLLLNGLASKDETTVGFTGEAVSPDAVAEENSINSDPKGILLGRALAAALGAKFGDRVTLVVSLPSGGINAVEVNAMGFLSTGVKANDDIAVRMPLALGRELLRVRGSHLWVVCLSATERTD